MTPPQPTTEVGLRGQARPMRRRWSGLAADRGYLAICVAAALIAFVLVAYLVAKTLAQTSQLQSELGFVDFLKGREWIPATGTYGALPAIYGTIVTSTIAMAIAVPLAISLAIATTVLLPQRARSFFAHLIDLLAAIPSVVYGLWAIFVLVPAVKPGLEWISRNSFGLGAFEGPVLGQSLLLAGLVLAVMVLPIITAVIREVFLTVPVEQREAALALGATRWEMVKGAMLPWSRSGIVGASALGLGRAVGETIAVAMILGSQPTLFKSLLGPGQTLAGTIAFEYNSAIDRLHASTLVGMAVVLFVLAFAVNLLARLLVSRSGSGRARRKPLRAVAAGLRSSARTAYLRATNNVTPRRSPLDPPPPRPARPTISRARRVRSHVAEGVIYVSILIAAVPLLLVIWYAVVKGAASINLDFFTSDGEPDIVGNGIKHALFGTVVMMGISTVLAVPIGILAALFIREASDRGTSLRRIANGFGLFVDMLLGVPSIVAGLVVAITLVVAMGSFSAFAGGCALAIIMFPIVVRTTDEILRLVPNAQIEAALALGAPRWRTTWSVVLPVAAPGIVTGILIALARVSGETAPLILTVSGAQFFSTDVFSEMSALPLYIFNGTINSSVPIAQEHAWGAALVLVFLVLSLNIGARLLMRFSKSGVSR